MTTPTYAELLTSLRARLQSIGLQSALHEHRPRGGARHNGLMLYADLLNPALSTQELEALDREAGGRSEHRLRGHGHRTVNVAAAAWILPLTGGVHAVVFAEGRGLSGLRVSGVETDPRMSRSEANRRVREWLEALSEHVAEAAVS